MIPAPRDLWPDAPRTFWMYLWTSLSLGLLAVVLEHVGLSRETIVAVVLVLVLPAHYTLWVIRKRVHRPADRPTSAPPPPPPEPPRARAAGAGQ